MAGAIRASPIDEPFTSEATSIEPTGIIDVDISESSEVGELFIRSSCKQGTCPDNKAPFDFMKRFWQDYSSEHNIAISHGTPTTSASTTAGNAYRRRLAVTDAQTSLPAVESRIYVSILTRDALIGFGKTRTPRNATAVTMTRLEAVGWRRGMTFIDLIRRLSIASSLGQIFMGVVGTIHTSANIAEVR